MLKGSFASSVFHSCNAKTQKTQICITDPQCVNNISKTAFLEDMKKLKERANKCIDQGRMYFEEKK
jgi:hypothetical protein